MRTFSLTAVRRQELELGNKMNYQQQFFVNKMASLFDRLNIQKPKAFTERESLEIFQSI